MMEQTLERAMELRFSLRKKLERVEQFIADYASFANGDMPTRSVRSPSLRVVVPGRPKEAFDQMVKVLSEAAGPMTKAQIIDACAADGYVVPGKRQADYVAILAFRNKDKIEHVGRGTYALRTETSVNETGH
jgi:hypothetical protein